MSSPKKIKLILEQLCGFSKLERDRAEIALTEEIKNCTEYSDIINWINVKLKEKKPIECCLGCLTAFKVLLCHDRSLSTEFLCQLADECITFNQHDEYRVRILAGECLGELCRVLEMTQFSKYITLIKAGIKSNTVHSNNAITESSTPKVNNENALQGNSEWKNLETWIKCLQCVINGLDKQFKNIVDKEMLTIIFEVTDHNNRFVRESCFDIIGTLAEKEGFVKHKSFYLLACDHLGKGLSDNWSQVRMPASVAVRKLLLSPLPKELTEEEVYKGILPKICLNRYYAAEGVRLFNQETWRLVVGNRGKEIIKGNIKETVDFYCEQSIACNHDAREAACSSISELVSKIDPDIVRPFVKRLLRTLEVSMSDEVWSVRDLSCMACGRLVASFPTEAREYRNDGMLSLFLDHVMDSMAPVRESGAYSVAATVNAYCAFNADLLKDVLIFIYDNLENVKNQIPGSDRIVITKKKPSRQSKEDVICDYKQGLSCDEPRFPMSRVRSQEGGKVGGVVSDSALWERADGSMILIGELSVQVPQSHEHMPQLIPAIVKALSYRHYSQHVYLLATVAGNLTKLCDGLGKQHFKKYLTEVLDIVDACLASDCTVAVSAAEDAVRGLSARIGESIVRGRIEMHSRHLLDRTNHLFH